MNPLTQFQSTKVRKLLRDFHEQNFALAGLPIDIAHELVDLPYFKKSVQSEQEIRTNLSKLLQKARKLHSFQGYEIDPMTLLKIPNPKVLLDIGSNNLVSLNKLGGMYPSLRRLIGIDVKPQSREFSFPEKSEYHQISSPASLNNFPIKARVVDFVNIQYVFHHFPSEQAIRSQLEIIEKIMMPHGYLILWEESFTQQIDLEKLIQENEALSIKTDFDLTKRFYELSEKERFEFIQTNDWIINTGHEHMQWTGQYRRWDKWVDLLRKYNFTLEREYNLGLRVNGLIKHGAHVIGVFQLSSGR